MDTKELELRIKLKEVAFSNMVRQLELPAGTAWEGYSHQPELIQALQDILAECRAGNCQRADILDLGRIAEVPLDQVGCTEDEVLQHCRAGMIQVTKRTLARVRAREYSALPLAVRLVDQALAPPFCDITLEELETDAEEMERFRGMARLL